jgi:hypothetical protein
MNKMIIANQVAIKVLVTEKLPIVVTVSGARVIGGGSGRSPSTKAK